MKTLTLLLFTILVAPTFTKSYYNGSYSITDDVPQLDVETISFVSDYNDLELVSVDLQEEGISIASHFL